jgi:hypothetical protein
MVVALSLRASRVVISVFALAWFCVAALPSLARGQQHTAPLPRDMSFGSGGFVTIPSVDMNAPSAMPLGFVRLPVSAGYLVFQCKRLALPFASWETALAKMESWTRLGEPEARQPTVYLSP